MFHNFSVFYNLLKMELNCVSCYKHSLLIFAYGCLSVCVCLYYTHLKMTLPSIIFISCYNQSFLPICLHNTRTVVATNFLWLPMGPHIILLSLVLEFLKTLFLAQVLMYNVCQVNYIKPLPEFLGCRYHYLLGLYKYK